MTKLLPTPGVSALTGIPEATLRYWRHLSCRTGTQVGPRSAKLGRRVVYREEDVLAWIDEQFEKQGPAA